MHRLVYVRHASGLLEAGFKLLHVLIFVVFGLWVLNRNLSWTYAQLLKGSNLHRMPKGIFCMAKNLTEVIGNVKMDQTKEVYVVTSLYRGKIPMFINTIIYNIVAIACLLLSLKSRSKERITPKVFMEFNYLRHKYDIIKSYQNIMDIKLQFFYTLLLNQTNVIDQVMNIFLQIFYEKIGPNDAFSLWWSVFLFENIGQCRYYLGKIHKKYNIPRIKIGI